MPVFRPIVTQHQTQGRINHWASKAKAYRPSKNSALKNNSDFSSNSLQIHKIQRPNSSAASRYSIALRLSIAVAASPSVSQPVAGRRPLTGHRLTDWAKQKSALVLEPGSLRPQQPLIQL